MGHGISPDKQKKRNKRVPMHGDTQKLLGLIAPRILTVAVGLNIIRRD